MSIFNPKEEVYVTEINGVSYRVFPKYISPKISGRSAKERVRQAYLGKGDPFVKVTTGSDRNGEFHDYLVPRGSLWTTEYVDVPEDIQSVADELVALTESEEEVDEAEILKLKATLVDYFRKG